VLLAGTLLFSRVAPLVQHTLTASGLPARIGAWQTAMRVILARPLTGIGLGTGPTYVARVEPYRIDKAVTLVDHPHNSYLEYAVLAGLPAVIAFLGLLFATVGRIVGVYRRAQGTLRILTAGALACVVVVGVISLSDAGWTLAPLGATLWLILGAVTSPALQA